jgi:chromosome segregation ATPase
LENQYAEALKTIVGNEAVITALRTELEAVKEQGEASRRRARELADDLGAAMERHKNLIASYNQLQEEVAERARGAEGRARDAE